MTAQTKQVTTAKSSFNLVETLMELCVRWGAPGPVGHFAGASQFLQTASIFFLKFSHSVSSD